MIPIEILLNETVALSELSALSALSALRSVEPL